jgi:hypothetical protein
MALAFPFILAHSPINIFTTSHKLMCLSTKSLHICLHSPINNQPLKQLHPAYSLLAKLPNRTPVSRTLNPKPLKIPKLLPQIPNRRRIPPRQRLCPFQDDIRGEGTRARVHDEPCAAADGAVLEHSVEGATRGVGGALEELGLCWGGPVGVVMEVEG